MYWALSASAVSLCSVSGFVSFGCQCVFCVGLCQLRLLFCVRLCQLLLSVCVLYQWQLRLSVFCIGPCQLRLSVCCFIWCLTLALPFAVGLPEQALGWFPPRFGIGYGRQTYWAFIVWILFTSIIIVLCWVCQLWLSVYVLCWSFGCQSCVLYQGIGLCHFQLSVCVSIIIVLCLALSALAISLFCVGFYQLSLCSVSGCVLSYLTFSQDHGQAYSWTEAGKQKEPEKRTTTKATKENTSKNLMRSAQVKLVLQLSNRVYTKLGRVKLVTKKVRSHGW